ncbi:MAG: iron complex outermembrane receptor protein [Halioglobus sp.]|jgi:iron complex outermembrane receptor protein
MKRILLATLVGAASHAMAQNSTERLEHVLVSVPIHKKTSETALPVTVLSGEALRRAVASNIGETLNGMPGIASASFGPGVGRPVIRGQQGARAITLNNGIAAADVSSLSPDHAVSVEPMLAESIEVLRGPATLLYGGGAIGGVINVIDNRIPRASIEGVQGSVEYRNDSATSMDTATVKLEAGTGDFAFHFSGTTRDFDNQDIPGLAIDEVALEEQEELLGGEHDEEHEEEEVENSNGFIANTDGDSDTYTVGASYQLGERGFVGLSYNSFETVYGIPPGSHGHEEEEEHEGEEEHEEEEEIIRIDLKQDRYDAQLHYHDLAPGLIDVARAFLTYTDYEHVELEGSEVGTLFERETWEGRLELVRETEDHSVLGLQWRSDEFAAIGEEAYVPKTDSLEWGVFYVQDFHADDWQFEAGARADWVERDPDAMLADKEDFTSISLSGAAIYTFNPAWSLGLAVSRSERAPAAEELFSNVDNSGESLVTHAATGIIEIGDPGLDKESAVNADVSLKWQAAQSWAELTVFYNRFDDYIFLLNSGTDADETPVYAYEQDDADFFGVEFQSSFHLADIAEGGLALEVFGDFISAEFDNAGDIPRLPPHRIGAKLAWTGSALGAYVRVVDAGDQDNPGDFETETAGYTRWDAGVDYSVTLANDVELLAFLKLKNISDEEIRLSTSFLRNFAPQAGESVEAGIRLTF